MKQEIEWPFDQPKNCAVFTICQIIEGDCPILVVYHEQEDAGWQFLANIKYTMDDTRLVGLEEITKIDPTTFEIATIKPGSHAWRNKVGDRWTIAITPDLPDD